MIPTDPPQSEPSASSPPRLVGADAALADDPVRAYLDALATVLAALPQDAIWRAAEMLHDAGAEGRRIYLIGNGGSAATASHMANDLGKQASVPGRLALRPIAFTDNVPLLTAWSNDLSFEAAFSLPLAAHLEPGDVVVAISTSGNSPNVLAALRLAQRVGARTIGLAGHDGGAMAAMVECCICVPTRDIGQQEDVHLVVNHLLAMAVRVLGTRGDAA